MGEEQPSERRAIAEKSLAQFASLRASLRQRIHEIDRMSQREIIQAADDMNTIYHTAISQIESLKSHLSVRVDEQGKNQHAHDLKISALEACIVDFDQKVNELKGVAKQSADATLLMKTAALALEKNISSMGQVMAEPSATSKADTACVSQIDEGAMHALQKTGALLLSISLTIQQLAGTLASLLACLERGIADLGGHAQTFSRKTFEDISIISEQECVLQKEVARALENSDLALGVIVKTSQSALSHMQFQDAISQGLMRLDTIAYENEVALCREVGLEDRIASLAPVMHVELGGDKAVEQKNAGKVVLF